MPRYRDRKISRFGRACWVAGLAALSVSAPGCATRQFDYNNAVEVRVTNEADFPITVQAIRSVAVVDFERTVAGNVRARFLVSHGAFGDGPIRFSVLTGPWPILRGFRTVKKLKVPAGSLVDITLRPDLRSSLITVYGERRERAEIRRRIPGQRLY
jgi:hypothetical protein